MIHAFLHGKLGGEFVRNPYEIEDLLTAVVLGSCQYVAHDIALLPFLGGARLHSQEDVLLRDLLGPVSDVDFEFWPAWGCEPELLLKFSRPGRKSAWLIVEAKLLSGKSSIPTSTGSVNDQLGKYWLALKAKAGDEVEPLGVVYITRGLVAPVAEFEETQAELSTKKHPRAPLFWLSWRRFVEVVHRQRSPLVRDVCRLLESRWKLVMPVISAWPSVPARAPSWCFDADWSWSTAPAVPAPECRYRFEVEHGTA